METVQILGIQLGCSPVKQDNLRRAVELIEEGMKAHPQTDVICLPEFFYELPTHKNIKILGEPLDSVFNETFSDLARHYKVNIIAGSFPCRQGKKLLNTVPIYNREGKLLGNYTKTHLFDGYDIKESEVFTPGDKLGIFDMDFGRIGVLVCYELRFPEFIRTLVLKEIDILFVPAAFFVPRRDQWVLLTKSAAVSNLIHVVGVNQFGKFKNMMYFGRSSIIDPWGITLAGAPNKECYFYGEIDLAYQRKAREILPDLNHRRPDLYSVSGGK